jgi:hypothetical protein
MSGNSTALYGTSSSARKAKPTGQSQEESTASSKGLWLEECKYVDVWAGVHKPSRYASTAETKRKMDVQTDSAPLANDV